VTDHRSAPTTVKRADITPLKRLNRLLEVVGKNTASKECNDRDNCAEGSGGSPTET
jgi:hypothetical protein